MGTNTGGARVTNNLRDSLEFTIYSVTSLQEATASANKVAQRYYGHASYALSVSAGELDRSDFSFVEENDRFNVAFVAVSQ